MIQRTLVRIFRATAARGFLLVRPLAPAFAQPYYVAPTGSDTSPGTLARPFATLARAQHAAREWLARRAITTPVPADFPTATAASVRGEIPLK